MTTVTQNGPGWKKFNFVNLLSFRWITWFKIQVKQTRPNVDPLMHGCEGWGGIFIHFLGFQTLIIILKLYRVCNLLQFSPSSNWLVFLWHSYGCCKCQCVCESFGHLCDTEALWQEITKFCPKIHLKSGKSFGLDCFSHFSQFSQNVKVSQVYVFLHLPRNNHGWNKCLCEFYSLFSPSSGWIIMAIFYVEWELWKI